MGAGTRLPTIDELVTSHYAALYRYAYRLAGCGSEAEDLTQEAFCAAQAKRGQLRDPGRVKPWLFSILRNAYLHRCRRRRLAIMVPLEEVAEPATVENAPPWQEIEPERLQDALNGLPEEFRTPIILYYFEDFSYRDIAEQMASPIGTVMSRLARAKEQLRRILLPAEEEKAKEAIGSRSMKNAM